MYLSTAVSADNFPAHAGMTDVYHPMTGAGCNDKSPARAGMVEVCHSKAGVDLNVTGV
jgi:hypothetical protein